MRVDECGPRTQTHPCMKRRRRVIAILCLVAAVSSIAILSRDKEPRYGGRALSEWARMRETRFPDDYGLTADANQAVRSIGTNAIPTALRWLSHEPSPITRITWALLEKLPQSLKSHFARKHDSRPWDAYEVLSVLGPEARCAIPELTRLAVTCRDASRAHLCVKALVNIGPEAVPGLTSIITHGQSEVRFYAIVFLAKFGTNAAPAVPALVKSLDDQADNVAYGAAIALGLVGTSNPTVVSALTASLQSSNAWHRASAAMGLAGLGGGSKARYTTTAAGTGRPV